MMVAFWCVAAFMAYSAGFVGVTLWVGATCSRERHTQCNHMMDTPGPAFWPVWLVLGVATSPFWGTYLLAKKVDERRQEHARRKALHAENGAEALREVHGGGGF